MFLTDYHLLLCAKVFVFSLFFFMLDFSVLRGLGAFVVSDVPLGPCFSRCRLQTPPHPHTPALALGKFRTRHIPGPLPDPLDQNLWGVELWVHFNKPPG